MTSLNDTLIFEAQRGAPYWGPANWFSFLDDNFPCARCNRHLRTHAWYPYGGRNSNAVDYGVCALNPSMTEWSKELFRPRVGDAQTLGQLLLIYSKTQTGISHLRGGFLAHNDWDSTKTDLLYDLVTRPAKYQIPMDSNIGVCTDYD